jgi:hypothetical protein
MKFTSFLISVVFSAKYCLFHNCIFFCSNNTFFLNCTLKCKYQLGHLKVKGRTQAHITTPVCLQMQFFFPTIWFLLDLRPPEVHELELWDWGFCSGFVDGSGRVVCGTSSLGGCLLTFLWNAPSSSLTAEGFKKKAKHWITCGSTGIPLYLLIQYPRFTAARKKFGN